MLLINLMSKDLCKLFLTGLCKNTLWVCIKTNNGKCMTVFYSLSVDVLQGFTCSRVQKYSKVKIRGLIKACRRRENRAKVVLSETQVRADKNAIQKCVQCQNVNKLTWFVANCFPSWLACTTKLELNQLWILPTTLLICCCTMSKVHL